MVYYTNWYHDVKPGVLLLASLATHSMLDV
jgi:hypothetical protein